MGNFFIKFKKSGKHAGIQILFINPWRLIKTMNRCQEGLLLVGKLKEGNKKATKDSSSNNNKTRHNNNNKLKTNNLLRKKRNRDTIINNKNRI